MPQFSLLGRFPLRLTFIHLLKVCSMSATMVDGSWQQKEPHRLAERGRHKPVRKAHHGRCSPWGEQRRGQFDKQQVKLGQGLHEERILTHLFRWRGEGAQLKGRAVGDEKASHAQEKAGRVSLFTR